MDTNCHNNYEALMQFEAHSHRGFSPVISSVTKQSKPFKRLLTPLGNANTALKRRCE